MGYLSRLPFISLHAKLLVPRGNPRVLSVEVYDGSFSAVAPWGVILVLDSQSSLVGVEGGCVCGKELGATRVFPRIMGI